MTTATLRLDIVSAEQTIFSGEAKMVSVMGAMGELGITPGHSPLMTAIKPGEMVLLLPNQEEELFYVKGGFMEVQPYVVTVLADTVVRAADLDEAAALQAKAFAEQRLAEKGAEMDLAKAAAELAEAIAQIRAIQKLRKRIQ